MNNGFGKIQENFNIKVISIIYNSGEEIESEDKFHIYDSLKDIEEEGVMIIINNNGGGDFFAAFNISLFLYNKFHQNLFFLVPKICASASVLPLLLGSRLYMSSTSFLTQCDCYFTDLETPPYFFRAKENLMHPNLQIREKAKKYYSNSVDVLKTFFQTPNSLIYPNLPKGRKHKESFMLGLIDNLARKGKHSDELTMRKMQDLKFNVSEMSNEIKKEVDKYLNDCYSKLDERAKRFCIETIDGIVYFD